MDLMIPEKELRAWVGPFDDVQYYIELGRSQADKIIKLTNMKPNDVVLDLGCGCGRLSTHFLEYFNQEGRYIGLDNHREMLSFCDRYISPQNESFNFQHIDVYHPIYNNNGKISAVDMKLPIEADSVDIVILWSVFTHMYFDEVTSYIHEVHRVLKSGGRVIFSFNLYNDFIAQQIKEGKSHLDMQNKVDATSNCMDLESPTDGFAHSEDSIKELLWDSGFFIEGIHYGNWCSKDIQGEFHDVIVALKI